MATQICLRDENLKAAIFKLSGNLRSEGLRGNVLESYTGEIINQVSAIQSNVIYGRRGTGKTHLLQALTELYFQKFYGERNFPVYIDLRSTNGIDFEKSKKNNVTMFIKIIIQILDEIEKNIDYYNK